MFEKIRMRIEITEKNYKEASICIVNDIFNKYIKIVKHIHNTRGDIQIHLNLNGIIQIRMI